MERRDFLRLASALPAAGLVPNVLWAAGGADTKKQANVNKAAAKGKRQKTIVLIKLTGGNDGLNTLIPAKDYARYEGFRKTIALPKHKLVSLDGSGMAHNPYMARLEPWWKKGNMAWVQGVGYPHAVLSHFRSNDIWETATDAFEQSEMGWLSQVLPKYKKGLHGIILGEGLGPMAGKDCYTIAMQSPQVFLNQVDLVKEVNQRKVSNPALAHVVNIQHQLHGAAQQLKEKMLHPRPIGGDFSTSVLGRRLESVAQMIINDVDTGVYKVEHNGFDTHAKQLNIHNNLLFELSVALDSFADAMQRHGRWDDVLVVTYSEFGRRVQQNLGGGTDHGAASVQLVMGGKVRGGIYGDNPRLNDLDRNGNLHMTTDFRSVYGTLASRWFGVGNPWEQFGTVPFV